MCDNECLTLSFHCNVFHSINLIKGSATFIYLSFNRINLCCFNTVEL